MLKWNHPPHPLNAEEELDARIARVYGGMIERAVPSGEIVEQATALGRQARARKPPRLRRKPLRRLILAAALLCCLCAALPALAAGSPMGYRLLYALSPAAAQLFVPVQQSSTDQGIRMEVHSIYVHGDTAEVYLSLQDLAGNRVDATTDLFDSYNLNIPFDNTGACSLAGYDPETRTALFLAKISTMDGRDLPRGKVTFMLRCFISGKRQALDVPIALELSQAATAPETRMADPAGGSIPSGQASLPDAVKMLVPGEPLSVPMEGFAVTAMGYIDGALHVQLQIPQALCYSYDYHGFLTLKNAAGEELTPHTLSFRDSGDAMDYTEFIFHVSPEQLSDYTLYGSFYAAASRVDGSWQVTFPLVSTQTGTTS